MVAPLSLLCLSFAHSLSLHLSGIWSSVVSPLALTSTHNFHTSLIARVFRGNGPRLYWLPGTCLTPSPASHPPTLPWGLMRRWELLVSELSPRLVPCLIGVLLVTINSFLSVLQAALICCHTEESNVQFHSHRTTNYRLWCQLRIVFFFFNFLFLLLYCLLWLEAEMAFAFFSHFSGLPHISSRRLREGANYLWALIQDKILLSWVHISFYFEVTVYLKCSFAISERGKCHKCVQGAGGKLNILK